ncbi:non-ribosomal peptide synthetase, partial [Duganella sp. Root1480D1]|uniref:non-ribosomal peptide synthetase n=1 Tax=Duganella sp. Root1480D1 TaxID=1736471 RepID=UPI000A80777A
LSANGKLDRKALPAPDEAALAARPYEAPQGEAEQVLAQVWQELLGVERVGRHDHFFELGGHSLLAVQVVSRLRQTLNVEVSLRKIFAAPTLAEFAAAAAATERTRQEAIPLADRTRDLPLSWAQQRLWFLTQLDGSSRAYHMPSGMRLRGPLDRNALQGAFNAIVARHEILRTTFVERNGQAVQCIAPADAGLRLEWHDLSMLHGHELDFAVERMATDEASQAFDLGTGPLLRARMLHLGQDDHVLLLTVHHIVFDGWSTDVLLRELAVLYSALARGAADPLPALPLQYADFAAWQRSWLNEAALQSQVAYWRKHLEGAPDCLELATDYTRPALPTYAGDSVDLQLPPALTADLRALCRRQGVTMFMTLMAAWAALLARCSGQQDVVIGTPVANRQRQELEPLIGFFVNTLPLRMRLGDDITVSDLLEQVKNTALDGFACQDLPFEQMVEALQPRRSTSHNPLFQAFFALNNTPQSGGEPLAGLSISSLGPAMQSAQFDLSLLLAERGDQVYGTLNYATDLFQRATIERMLAQFVVILAAMCSAPEARVQALPLLDPAERERILAGFNAGAAPAPLHQLVHRPFELRAQAMPDAPALRHGERVLSYGELNARANALAQRLIELGVAPGSMVAVLAERGCEMVIAVLATLKAGGAYVPLDPGYPEERLGYMVSDSAPSVLLTQQALAQRIAAPGCPVLLLDAEAGSDRSQQADPLLPELAAEHLAYVIYTSGSTGKPKGVAMPHGPLCNLLQWQADGVLGAPETTLQFAALGFDVAFQEIFSTLSLGACLVLIDEDMRRDPQALLALIAGRKVARVFLPYIALQSLAQAVQDGGVLPSSLRDVITAGEQLRITPAIAALFRQLPQCRLHNHYGPTESHVVTSHILADDVGQWPLLPPIGRPIANARVHVLDTDLQPVPVGILGEVFLGGSCLARGYLNRPQLTAERFIANPFGAGKLYKTGDLARYRDDGSLEYVGRADFQVKLRGYRVEPGEVEVRLGACPGVRDVAVVVREDAPGERRLVAYLTAQPGAAQGLLDPGSLRQALAQELADYMIPSAFVQLEALPLSPNGKLDRRALPAPDKAALATREYAAPQGEVEQALAQIWQELLGVERVGRHDHFFELGGHSLLAVQVVSRLRELLGREVALRKLFEQPTLAGLAQLVAASRQTQLGTLTVAERGDALPLSWAQQRLWFLDQLDHAAGAAYHIPAGLH